MCEIDNIFFGFNSFYSPETTKEVYETEDSVCLIYATSAEKITLKVERCSPKEALV